MFILVRRHPDPLQIIPAILNSNPQAYKNTGKVRLIIVYMKVFITRF